MFTIFNKLPLSKTKTSIIISADLERRELAEQFNSQQDAKLNRQHQLEMSVRVYQVLVLYFTTCNNKEESSYTYATA